LRQYAPTWLAQRAAVVGDALEAFTAEQPLIVVLEALH
jgi:hypothetical protein